MNFFELKSLPRKNITGIFILKIIAGLCLWALYTFYYTNKNTSDIYKFYNDARCIYQALPHHPLHYLQMVLDINTNAEYLQPYYAAMHNWYAPWQGARFHDNGIIIQFNALIYLFSFGYYNVHTVFMCFISLVGLTAIYKTFAHIMPSKLTELAIAVYLIPSVIFWSSGVLKEGIIIFALGMLLYHLYNTLYGSHSLKSLILFILSALLLTLTKMYVFAAIAPSIVALIWVHKTHHRYIFLKFVCVHLLFFLAAANLYRINDHWDILWFLHIKQMGFIHTAIVENAGSYININYLDSTAISIIQNTPQALINTLFRPHLFESTSLLTLMPAIENILFMVLALACIKYYKKPTAAALPLLFTSIFFVFTLAVLIGLITPVLGSIVRYRVPIMPFYTIIMLLLLDTQKIKKSLGLNNKN